MIKLKEVEMKLYREINLLEDRELLKKINIASVIIMLLSAVFIYLIFPVSLRDIIASIVNIKWIIIIFVVGFLLFILHELVHGFFFKLFNMENKLKFGYTSGMLYASSPGSLYSIPKFFIIAISPFIVVSIILFIMNEYYPVMASLIFIIHTAGCVGDFYYCYLILKYPKDLLIEDTDTGIRFFEKEKR